MTGDDSIDGNEGKVLYSPPEWAPVPGAMYPRAVRLDHADTEGETLLATFECYTTTGESGTDPPHFLVFRSTDGGQTWSEFSAIRDTQHGWGLRYQPTLFELPKRIGSWERGTVLAAGNAIPTDRSKTSIDVYASEDGGESWEYVSTVATGGKAVPARGESPVWEPEFAVDANDNLVCYFSDERHSSDGYDQLIGHKVSKDGGRTWESQTFDVAIQDDESRPGMPVVTTVPTGEYVMVYELIGPRHGGALFVKTSSDGTDWGDPEEIGSHVRTEKGAYLSHGPYIAWTPYGSEGGMLLVSGKTFRDQHGNAAPESGTVLLANSDLTGAEPWEPVSAPLWFEDELETGYRSVGWTSPLVPLKEGRTLLQMTSTYAGRGHTEIRYAVVPSSSMQEDHRIPNPPPSDESRNERQRSVDLISEQAHRRFSGTSYTAIQSSLEDHHVKSVGKTFEILEALEETEQMGITELSQQTGIPKSSVYKYVDTLKQIGVVTKVGSKYSLSLRVFQSGQRIVRRQAVYHLAQPKLEELSEMTGETVFLVVEEDGRAVYLHRSSAYDSPHETIREGTRLPVHISTGGKALLSYRSEEYVESVLDDMELDLDRRSLRADLERAHENRIVLDQTGSDEPEYSAGLAEGYRQTFRQQRVDDRLQRVAVPIRNGDDEAIAAIEMIGSEFSLHAERLEDDVIPLLVSTAKSIETDLLNN